MEAKNEILFSSKQQYMSVNVILTFNTFKNDDKQEVFDIKLPISSHEISAFHFFHLKFFKRVQKKCITLNRNPKDLIKISTCSDWNLFEKVTNLPALCEKGHPCKWYFGNGRNDLDVWEKELMRIYGFGTNHDMSWVNDGDYQSEMRRIQVEMENQG